MSTSTSKAPVGEVAVTFFTSLVHVRAAFLNVKVRSWAPLKRLAIAVHQRARKRESRFRGPVLRSRRGGGIDGDRDADRGARRDNPLPPNRANPSISHRTLLDHPSVALLGRSPPARAFTTGPALLEPARDARTIPLALDRAVPDEDPAELRSAAGRPDRPTDEGAIQYDCASVAASPAARRSSATSCSSARGGGGGRRRGRTGRRRAAGRRRISGAAAAGGAQRQDRDHQGKTTKAETSVPHGVEGTR